MNQLEDYTIEKDDIIIFSNLAESGMEAKENIKKDLSCEIIDFRGVSLSSSRIANNKILSILDSLIEKVDLNKNNVQIKIRGGSFIFNNYLLLLADIYDISCFHKFMGITTFRFSVDNEELKIFKEKLKDNLSKKEYRILPEQWKSLYYQKNDKIFLSKLGRELIARN